MEAARVLNWKDFEIDIHEGRDITYIRKADKKLYIVRKVDSAEKDHNYTIDESFTL